MNEVMANIKSRRSTRRFLDKSIPEAVINDIIEAGRYAPSGLNKQPWKYIVITDKNRIKRLSDIVKSETLKIDRFLPLLRLFKPALRDPQIVGAIKKTISSESDTVFYSAPLLILIASERLEPFACQDCSLASQNMMLYANSLGIASCFIGRAAFLEMNKEARDIIGLPPRHKLQSAIVFGYAAEGRDEGAVPKRRGDNIINWVR